MRLTVGMLRQVIREEVKRARRGRLYESMGDPESMVDPELKSLDAVARMKGHAVDFNHDKIMKMSRDDCEAYGFPPGTLYCNVGGREPYLKFPGRGQTWAHESRAQANERVMSSEPMEMSRAEAEEWLQNCDPEQVLDQDILDPETGEIYAHAGEPCKNSWLHPDYESPDYMRW